MKPNGEIPKKKDPCPSEDGEVLKILSIGNSHSQDSVWLLPPVFSAHKPNQKFLIAECYFSGAMTEHMENVRLSKAFHHYYTNRDGENWTAESNITLHSCLVREKWDIVIINESCRHLGLESKAGDPNLIPAMIRFIEETLPCKPRIFYNWTWSNPTDEYFYRPERPIHPPPTFRTNYTKNYGFDRVNHYNMMLSMVEKYIEPNEKFDQILYVATIIQYATEVLKIPQPDLYRDYTHLNDYGRLMVAYYIYARLEGLEKIERVKIDTVIKKLQFWRVRRDYDIPITEEMKKFLMESVNYALENPKMPE